MKILIINGPNLNLLGIRQVDIYGSKTMDEVIGEVKECFSNHEIEYFQSNHEGAIIDKLHQQGFTVDGIVLNAGALTHTSLAIADAVSAITSPVLELHISDIYKREEFRQVSYLKAVCCHHIIGHGTNGYGQSVEYFVNSLGNKLSGK